MRIFLLLLCALSINITLAQRGGGGRQGGQSLGGGQGQGMGDRQHREVVEFDANNKVVSIEEKPEKAKSRL